MKVQDYVKRNWTKLPKSTFNGEEVVIVEEVLNDDYGYGHHSYEGWGVDSEGRTMWAFSSGCSCGGSCSVDHREDKTVKIFQANREFKKADWDAFNWAALQVDFSDY